MGAGLGLPFSPAVKAGNFVYVSGALATDEKGPVDSRNNSRADETSLEPSWRGFEGVGLTARQCGLSERLPQKRS